MLQLFSVYYNNTLHRSLNVFILTNKHKNSIVYYKTGVIQRSCVTLSLPTLFTVAFMQSKEEAS